MTILYFAWVKERRGLGEEEIALPAGVTTLGALIAHLTAQSDAHARALADTANLRVAVNQEMAESATPVRDGDEVAFFPPMTGG